MSGAGPSRGRQLVPRAVVAVSVVASLGSMFAYGVTNEVPLHAGALDPQKGYGTRQPGGRTSTQG